METDNKDQDIKFDEAKFEDSAPIQVCGVCQTHLENSYYEAEGLMACEKCKLEIVERSKRKPTFQHFYRAALYGAGAAFLGTAIYYGISALTGYEFGLVAIVVGLMVGWAVNRGSDSMGGKRFQALAMILTYFSIVTTYIPPLYDAIVQQEDQRAAVTQVEGNPGDVLSGSEGEIDSSAPPPMKKVDWENFSVFQNFILFIFLFAISLVTPILGGFDNIFGLIIIAIGLYEAWKLNKKVIYHFTGPYDLKKKSLIPPSQPA